ncbi:Phosphate-selective porin O and P [Flavobacteriaceae bacterium MAR_2010_188]|nr:Phosphate-selective porin O and P [Flavobacteriaceae bacterium MAR_2010_188]
MKSRIFVAFAGLLVCYNATSQTIETPTFGKGILNLKAKDSSWTMNFAARMQFLGTSEWQEEDGQLTEAQTNFLIRRARLKFGGYAFSPKLEYKLELGLSNRDIAGVSEFTSDSPNYIMDAVVKYNFYENFEIWFGQTKLPGNRERVISSGNLTLVDRSLLNSIYNIDRDVGLQLHHLIDVSDRFVIKEVFALSQGEGRNITTGNLGGHQYTARLEALPFGDFKGGGDYEGSDLDREPTPKLAIGATYDFNNNAVKNRSNQGSYMVTDNGFYETDITTIFLDAMFKYQGFSIMAEYAHRDADDPFAKNEDGSLTGAIVQVGKAYNFQASYLFKNDWEITGRYTDIALDKNITGRGTEDQYTLGLSKFLVGHNLKVQSDLSYLDTANGNNELMYRLQFDIHF